MKLIPLSQNSKKNKGKYFAMVDDEDYDYLMQWNWRAFNATKDIFYAVRSFRDKRTKSNTTIKMHRLILGLTNPKILVDHINHDGLNNQRNNLRAVNHQQNNVNRRSRGVYKYLGVSFQYNSWRGRVKFNGKSFHTPPFKSEEDAARARDILAKKLHGEFANLNFNQ